MPCCFFSSWMWRRVVLVWGPTPSFVCSSISSRQPSTLMRLCLARSPEKRCETFLQTHWHVDPFNFETWAPVEQVMSKYEVIPLQIAHCIVADAVWSVVDCLGDFGAIGAVK